MSTGSWKVRVDVDGARGKGTLSVPVPALSTRVLGMQKAVGAILIPLGLLLVFGLVAIVGAGVREAQLAPGAQPDRAPHPHRALGHAGHGGDPAVCVLWVGANWWNSAAGDYASYVYKPLRVNPSVESGNTGLQLDDPGWLNRRIDDLLPDHDHLMHLYVIHLPGMDRVWHLHPERGATRRLSPALPAMPAGRYALYGDIVHANGIGETVTAQIDLPEIHGEPLDGRRRGECTLDVESELQSGCVGIAGGYRMIWEGGGGAIHARRPYCSASAWRMRRGARPGIWNCTWGWPGTRPSWRRTAACSRTCIPPARCRWRLPGRCADAGQSACRAHDDGRRPARRGVLPVRVSQARERTASSCR